MAINIADFQVSQDEAELPRSKVELRGPRGEEAIRVHATWRAKSVAAVRHQGKFFVDRTGLFARSCAGHWFTVELRATCSSTGELFVWPVRDDDETMKQAAKAAVDKWLPSSGSRRRKSTPSSPRRRCMRPCVAGRSV